MEFEKGTFYWITGLSGAGKTTIGKLLYEHIHAKKNNIVFFDGDEVREIYRNKDYSLESRKNLMLLHERLCKELTDQGIDVVGCHIGMFKECQCWAKANIANCKIVHLKVDIDDLIKYDSKGLYKKAINKEIFNVYGIDLPYDEPQNADVVIENNRKMTPNQIKNILVDELNL